MLLMSFKLNYYNTAINIHMDSLGEFWGDKHLKTSERSITYGKSLLHKKKINHEDYEDKKSLSKK